MAIATGTVLSIAVIVICALLDRRDQSNRGTRCDGHDLSDSVDRMPEAVGMRR